MKSHIVITSIFEPTEAVEAFSKKSMHQLIVVGDKKSPPGWHCKNVDYIPVDEQLTIPSELARVLPYNHYSRKMLGYLRAIQSNAELIVDTDMTIFPRRVGAFRRSTERTTAWLAIKAS